MASGPPDPRLEPSLRIESSHSATFCCSMVLLQEVQAGTLAKSTFGQFKASAKEINMVWSAKRSKTTFSIVDDEKILTYRGSYTSSEKQNSLKSEKSARENRSQSRAVPRRRCDDPFFCLPQFSKKSLPCNAPQVTQRHLQAKLSAKFFEKLVSSASAGTETALSILRGITLLLPRTANWETPRGQSQRIASMLKMLWQPLLENDFNCTDSGSSPSRILLQMLYDGNSSNYGCSLQFRQGSEVLKFLTAGKNANTPMNVPTAVQYSRVQ